MQSGLVAEVNGEFDRIPDDDFPIIKEDGLKTTLYTRDRVENQSGDIIISGIAATEKRVNEDSVEITDEGRVNEDVTTTSKVTVSTEFVTVPGEFVILNNSKADFALDLLGKITNSMVTPVEFNLNAMSSDNLDNRSNIWMSGFYGYEGKANTGVAYGDNVFDDDDIGPVIRDGQVNQLGMTIDRGEDEVKFMITESGYIRIYSPSEYGTPSFVRLVKEFISQYSNDSSMR